MKTKHLENRADELLSMIENLPRLSYERQEMEAELEDIHLELENIN